jgi:hypothetical protein
MLSDLLKDESFFSIAVLRFLAFNELLVIRLVSKTFLRMNDEILETHKKALSLTKKIIEIRTLGPNTQTRYIKRNGDVCIKESITYGSEIRKTWTTALGDVYDNFCSDSVISALYVRNGFSLHDTFCPKTYARSRVIYLNGIQTFSYKENEKGFEIFKEGTRYVCDSKGQITYMTYTKDVRWYYNVSEGIFTYRHTNPKTNQFIDVYYVEGILDKIRFSLSHFAKN